MKVRFSLIRKCVLLVFFLTMGLSQSWSQDARPMDKKISNNMTLEQIDETVRAALPRGTTLKDIDKYFTASQIEHGYYKNTSQVLAMVHNIRGGFFPVSKGAQIIVTLDKADSLSSIEVKAVLTGP